jgi:Flp pilus assembly protein TadG
MRARVLPKPRGVTAVVVAIVLAVLAGFLALVINSGHMFAIRGQLQNASDSAALAGAQELNGTVPGLEAARDQAVEWAGEHTTDKGMSVGIDRTADVELGYWDHEAPRESAFTPITSTTPQSLRMTNAVRVRTGRETARGNPMNVTMGALLGNNMTSDIRAEAIAVLGGPCEEGCAVPIAFASCIVLNPDGSLNCGTELVFNSDVTDNIGFTNLSTDPSVSTTVLRNILNGDCKKVETGDAINVSNGANLSPLVGDFQPYIGKQVSAPVVDLGSCPAKFNEHTGGAPIVGFATFTITNVTGGANKAIYIRLDCQQIEKEPVSAGCQFFGTTPIKPRLVR